ncbi:hypothetical protein MTR_5g075250 [Medicago truncatula]|uniref:Uncharacterized protein n=1 Tax=Medicago truncatula TaxID=3880 RepID=G7K0S4_MEDTR|nr:hypothetical protein MTR_5g075250 [Medicago truncatula]
MSSEVQIFATEVSDSDETRHHIWHWPVFIAQSCTSRESNPGLYRGRGEGGSYCVLRLRINCNVNLCALKS